MRFATVESPSQGSLFIKFVGTVGASSTRAALWSLTAAALFAACTTACTTQPTASFPNTPQVKVDLVGLDPGMILITLRSNAPQISVDPPNRRMEPMGEGAADATRNFLNTPHLGNPQLEAGVGVVQFALAPFAAAYGAISAGQQRLSPAGVLAAQQQLAEAMSSNAVPETLVQKVGEIARQKTRRLLVCTGSSSNAPANGAPVSAVLELSVEHLWLRVAKPGGDQYVLSIEVRARLVSTSDERVLLRRSYHYQSGPSLFIDWTRYGGLEGVAQTGYQSLASQIADDVFEPPTGSPILIGPGQKRSRLSSVRVSRAIPARALGSESLALRSGTELDGHAMFEKNTHHLLLLASHLPRTLSPVGNRSRALSREFHKNSLMNNASLQFISFVQEEPGSMEIHTGKTDDRLHAPKPGPESGSDSGAMSDTKWSMDGLEYDRNAVVQGVSCLAAVPMGIWEQTIGLVHKRSQEQTDKLATALRTATTQGHFEGVLADEVTRCLQSRVVDPISRTDEPLRFALSGPSEASATGSTQPGTPAKSKTALEIQVLSTKLVGKHRNSRSRAVIVEIQATIFRTSDGQELYSCPVRYRSSEKRLKDWAASDAKLFRQELDECSRRTALALTRDFISRGLVKPLGNSDSPFSDYPH